MPMLFLGMTQTLRGFSSIDVAAVGSNLDADSQSGRLGRKTSSRRVRIPPLRPLSEPAAGKPVGEFLPFYSLRSLRCILRLAASKAVIRPVRFLQQRAPDCHKARDRSRRHGPKRRRNPTIGAADDGACLGPRNPRKPSARVAPSRC